MVPLMILIAIVAVAALALATSKERNRKMQAADEALQKVKRVAEEDTTKFGEELQELHIDTLATELNVAMRQDYQRALDCYEDAKQMLVEAEHPKDISEVTKTLEDGRYAQACVLARQNGDDLPQRRSPCFFNPAHGPAQTDVEWAPAGGVKREVPVCLADAERVEAGADPDTRRVRDGNRMVPWYEGGPGYSSYANGYYGSYAMNGLFPGFLIGSMMAGMWSPDVTGGEFGGGDDWSGGGDLFGGGDGFGGGDFGGDAGGDLGGGLGDFGGGFGDGGFGGFDGF